jgi:hypothetical protein
MQRVDLKKVLEMLINEEQGNAEDLLHQWFVEKTKTIHEGLMQEDDDILEKDDLTDKIEDDKDSIKAEEYFGESDFDEEGDEDSHIDAVAAKDVADGGTLATDDLDSEEGSEEPEGDDLAGEEDDELTHVADKVKDLEADLERLKSKFKEIQGGEEGEEDQEGDEFNFDAEGDEAGDHEEPDGDEDAEGNEPGKEPGEEGNVDESFLNEFDFVDLDEAFTLELIKDPGLDGSKEIGKEGGKVNVNTTSPIPQRTK